MRLNRQTKSVWMYGFPTRKHHYTEKGFIKRHSLTDRYEFKIGEHPSSAVSPHKSACNGKAPSGIKGQHDVNSILPALSKSQLDGRNGVISHNSAPGSAYGNFDNEVSSEHISYYGNLTGWHKYETPAWNSNQYQTTTRWSSSHSTPEVPRSPCRFPEPIPVPTIVEQPPISPLLYSKARFDWSKSNGPVPRARITNKIRSDAFRKSSNPSKESDTNTPSRSLSLEQTSLLKAIKLEDTNTAGELLDSELNEDVNAVDESGRTALSYLVTKNYVSLLEKLLKVPNVDINKPDNEGNTPLHYAAQAGQVEAVSLLLNSCSGIEVDARNDAGFTPLMKAALQGRTRCAKLLLFAGASPTMRDTGRGLRAEQWARYCGRYICADVIEKYARSQLLSKTTSYGNWGGEPELGLHFVNGKLQPPAISMQNAINQTCKQNSIKAKLKKAFQHSKTPLSAPKVNSYSLVTQLTSAALCVSSPVLPNSTKASPVVKSLIRPFVIPKVEITPDDDDVVEEPSPTEPSPKPKKMSCLVFEVMSKNTMADIKQHYVRRQRTNELFIWLPANIVTLSALMYDLRSERSSFVVYVEQAMAIICSLNIVYYCIRELMDRCRKMPVSVANSPKTPPGRRRLFLLHRPYRSADESQLQTSNNSSNLTSSRLHSYHTDEDCIDNVSSLKKYMDSVEHKHKYNSDSIFDSKSKEDFYYLKNRSLSPTQVYQLSPTASLEHIKPQNELSSLGADPVLCNRFGIDQHHLGEWIGNLRVWITQTILNRVLKQIDDVNRLLHTQGFGNVAVGEVGLERLKKMAGMAQLQRNIPTLNSLISFLDVSPNQEYVVRRIRELSTGYMSEYTWNGGGRAWDRSLPTDAALVMHLVASYLDTQLLPVPFLVMQGRQFSTAHYVIVPAKPPSEEKQIVIYQAELHPPHFQLIINKETFDVSRGRNNLFHTILFFLQHVKMHESGMFEHINLGASGINVLWIINEPSRSR